MALLKFLRRPGSSTDTAPGAGMSVASEAVQAARQQARRRLVGAVVLLGIGIIGFPLVFQTQPRPIPVDIPIEIPSRDKAPPLGGPVAVTPGKPEAAPASDKTASPEPASAKTAAAQAAAAPVEVEVLPPGRTEPAKAPLTTDAASEAAKPSRSAASEPTRPDAPKGEGDKDRGRFVVQAGSFTDLDAVREVRNKLERMGLKTYTQAAVIDGVTRVRVRVGPYSSRQEAQEVQNKIKAAGVAASLLQL